ncbi:MAG TPA: ankyrin repeat domain-containing protein [Ottowia sp.]|uniref:ankyrin repeat domain-containing protein n=1 Tax=Ottowia sp. TaxID=1898956 RepID=UPI002C9263AF|nr:ankyrin repeat domain-containing protein [Ottowia sp.]HMN22408.1 ankyrin repeat domain-containing protein [Ottowia sp.]
MRRATLLRATLVLLAGCVASLPVWSDAVGDFFRAIVQDDDGALRRLLARGVDPNARNDRGVPGLVLALQEDRLKAARVLLDSPRLKPEERNPAGESPLMVAALKGDLAIARRLIALDADVNKPGWTPLHYAATNGHVAMIELLLDENAFIDAEAPNGNTPLMMAAYFGSPEAVKVLIQAGADLRMRNRQGQTALDLAQQGGRANAAELLIEGLRRSQGVPRGQW